MNSQIEICDNCDSSYDSFFGICGCKSDVFECGSCAEIYHYDLIPKCPFCEGDNNVVVGAYRRDLEPLYKAISNGDVDYHNQPASVDYRLAFGGPVISIVTGNKDIKNLRRLLEDGANPNCLSSDGWSSLFHACQTGDVESFKLLIQYGANPDVTYYGDNWEKYWSGTEEEREELEEFIENIRGENIKGYNC